MAHQPNPNDRYRPSPSDGSVQRAAPLDNELQIDPELAEGPASGSRIAIFAVVIAVVLGGVFYGLNRTSINPAGTGQTATQTTPADQNTAQNSPPVSTGMRDVTPRSNTEPGTTVGAVPAQVISPPSYRPTGTQVDSAGTPKIDTSTSATK